MQTVSQVRTRVPPRPQVVRDKQTGKSRGYAFLRFASMEATLRALAEPSKPIDGRMAVCQLACLGPGQGTTSQEAANRKVSSTRCSGVA